MEEGGCGLFGSSEQYVPEKTVFSGYLDMTEFDGNISIDLRPRSSVWKTGLVLSNCEATIDEDFTGEVSAIFYKVAPGEIYKPGDRIGQVKLDKLKGFKVGLIANIPFFALFVFFVACGLGLSPNLRVTLYGYLNCFIQPLIYLISGCSNEITVSQLNALQYVLLFLVQFIVPIVCGVAYMIGFKEINLSEKIMYQKKEK